VKMLWQHEKTLILLGTVGLLYTASKRDYLPLAWTLGVLVPYSFVASRYDYYALLAYPPLPLGPGQAAIDVARRVQHRSAAWLPMVPVFANVLMLLPRIGRPIPGDAQIRQLAETVRQVSRP